MFTECKTLPAGAAYRLIPQIANDPVGINLAIEAGNLVVKIFDETPWRRSMERANLSSRCAVGISFPVGQLSLGQFWVRNFEFGSDPMKSIETVLACKYLKNKGFES
ncbi:hypothetical protein F2981_12170 [Sinorhizobium meliloti]|nr:hypothetical protein [Sinorhizobium meliloti]